MLMLATRRLVSAASSLANLVSTAIARSGRRRPDLAMLEWNERLLRDVGLSRADFVECLSSPWDNPEVFRQAHPVSHLRSVARLAGEVQRLAA